MSDPVDASNALVASVKFYSQALAEERAARQQLEATLRQLVDGAKLSRVAIALASEARRAGGGSVFLESQNDPNDERSITGSRLIRSFYEAVDEFTARMGRVEPARAREGAVRAAPADGDPDV